MNEKSPITTQSRENRNLAPTDEAFVRLVAAIVDEPEEVVLAVLLSKRSESKAA